jgi:hypothetical protein
MIYSIENTITVQKLLLSKISSLTSDLKKGSPAKVDGRVKSQNPSPAREEKWGPYGSFRVGYRIPI